MKKEIFSPNRISLICWRPSSGVASIPEILLLRKKDSCVFEIPSYSIGSIGNSSTTRGQIYRDYIVDMCLRELRIMLQPANLILDAVLQQEVQCCNNRLIGVVYLYQTYLKDIEYFFLGYTQSDLSYLPITEGLLRDGSMSLKDRRMIAIFYMQLLTRGNNKTPPHEANLDIPLIFKLHDNSEKIIVI